VSFLDIHAISINVGGSGQQYQSLAGLYGGAGWLAELFSLLVGGDAGTLAASRLFV
jgi:hypothetical protein